MAWVVKDVVARRLASGKVAKHTYFRVKERGPDGRTKVCGSFRRKPEAWAYLDKLQRFGPEALPPERPAPAGVTVSQVVRMFLEERFPAWNPDAGLIADSHFRTSKNVLERFAACAGPALPMALLSEESVRAFHKALVREDLAPASVFRLLGYVATFCRWARKRKLLPQDLEVERKNPKARRPALSWPEVENILAEAATWPEEHITVKGMPPGRLLPVLAALAYTGMRRDEACTLQWRDLILEGPRPVILIRNKPQLLGYKERFEPVDGKQKRVIEPAITAWSPKWGTHRAIPILPPLLRILRAQASEKPDPEGFVFTTTDNRPMSKWALSSALRRFGKARLGKPLGTHILRHSYATALARRVPAFVLMQVLGHASIETTQGYVDRSADLAALPADVLPELPPPAPSKPKALPAPKPQPDRVAERPALPLWETAAR